MRDIFLVISGDEVFFPPENWVRFFREQDLILEGEVNWITDPEMLSKEWICYEGKIILKIEMNGGKIKLSKTKWYWAEYKKIAAIKLSLLIA